MNNFNGYIAEVESRWGNTDAYKEYRQKEGCPSPDRIMSFFADFAQLRHLPHTDTAVQQKVGALQQFITDNFYTCTNEILASLGQMYVADERFMKNIDSYGEGTAQFVSCAIQHYCSQK